MNFVSFRFGHIILKTLVFFCFSHIFFLSVICLEALGSTYQSVALPMAKYPSELELMLEQNSHENYERKENKCNLIDIVNQKSLSRKKRCVFYGNCQMSVVYEFLKERFLCEYEYTTIASWEVLKLGIPLPVDKVKEADFFIYQPIVGWEEYDTDYIKDNILKESCVCISFPYIYFLGYFPDFFRDPNNEGTITNTKPWGDFPYGQQRLMDLIMENRYSLEEIVDITLKDDFISSDAIWKNFFYSLDILKEHEKSTKIILSDYIESNYSKIKLFHSCNHPTNKLLSVLIERVLTLMNLNPYGVENANLFKTELCGGWTNPIIYPCIAKTLNLEFDIFTSKVTGTEVSYKEYITEYIKRLYFGYYLLMSERN